MIRDLCFGRVIAVPDLAAWQWLLGFFCAFMVGAGKTGAPGMGTFIVPLMVMAVGDARYAAAWTVPILSTGDLFAVIYWRRHTEVGKLFSLIPWVGAGMVGGALALALSEQVLRRIIGVTIVLMLFVYLRQRRTVASQTSGKAPLYGVAAGFATTVANAAGPVMNMYLLSRRLPKEQFVATGAWFFFVVNLAKVPIYSWYDLFSVESLVFDAMMIPAVTGGAFLGLWLVRRTPQRVFDTMIILITSVSSILLFL
jgi:uncharacterized membrane protein YfcA